MAHVPHRHTILLAVLLSACSGSSSSTPASAPTPATRAAQTGQATVRKIDARELHAIATQTDGRPRLVNFWATWCGPCVAEMPDLTAFASAHQDVDVVLVNLDYPSLTQSHVIPFVKRHHLSGVRLVQLDDPDPATAVAKAVQGWPYAIPFTVLLGADGQRIATWNSGISQEDVERAVARAKPGGG